MTREAGQASSAPACLLFRWEKAWGLPSSSVACLQVEAYLRLAGVPFAVEDCTSGGSTSPTSALPALDVGNTVAGYPAASGADVDGFRSAANIIRYCARKDSGLPSLDSRLTSSQQAELAAFSSLITSALEPALTYGSWVDKHTFYEHTAPVRARGLPFPLDTVLPWRMRRSVCASMKDQTEAEVLGAAADALDAIDARLSDGARPGPYFLGALPSSLDASLYAILAFVRASPAAPRVLVTRVEGSAALRAYVDHIRTKHFAADALEASAWYATAAAGAMPSSRGTSAPPPKPKRFVPAAERRQTRGSRIWMLAAATAIAGYLVFGTDVFSLGVAVGEEDDEED